jgi:hypothetical protein
MSQFKRDGLAKLRINAVDSPSWQVMLRYLEIGSRNRHCNSEKHKSPELRLQNVFAGVARHTLSPDHDSNLHTFRLSKISD